MSDRREDIEAMAELVRRNYADARNVLSDIDRINAEFDDASDITQQFRTMPLCPVCDAPLIAASPTCSKCGQQAFAYDTPGQVDEREVPGAEGAR